MTPSKNTKSHVWRPFTQHATATPAINIARGEGAWLETDSGKRIYDAIASWWVITHGHRHPHIVDAIKKQAEQLDQVIFANFTHAPAENLATRLTDIVPGGYSHVFFSDSGSTAVEVALKMALGYWRNQRSGRHKIVALENAYHGDTVAAMSTGERGVFNAAYEPLLFDVARIPCPRSGQEQDAIDALEKVCANEPIAALIIEPLVLGAGGMIMYDANIIREFRKILDKHGGLLIADEIMTGWGRTGSQFAMEQTGVSADLMCLAKGLTGGTIPLAATLACEEIFEAHYSTDRSKTFFHSSSFTANPIACASANANLDIWESEPVEERIARLTRAQTIGLEKLATIERLENPRQCGTLAAIDLKTDDAGYLAAAGPKIMAFALDRGALIRPLGNTIYLMPPYCTTDDELMDVYQIISDAVAAID